MGKWGEHTHRHWRWTQFRFKTRFTTADIVLEPYDPEGCDIIAAIGDREPRSKTNVPDDYPINGQNSELACWIPLLVALHDNSAAIFKQLLAAEHIKRAPLPYLSWPAVRGRQRSWDFMPPDISRPFAAASLSTIAILSCRMGVVWREIRPPEGIMEGQGREHMFSAINIRGLGTLLGYTRAFSANSLTCQSDKARSQHRKLKERSKISSEIDTERGMKGNGNTGIVLDPIETTLWVCTPEADRMWFGILPGNPELSLPNFTVGTNEEVFATLQKLDPEGIAIQHLERIQHLHRGYLHGFCDIVPMIAPWLHQRASRVNCYPRPLGSQNTLGLTWYCVAYRVFYDQLLGYNDNKGTVQTRKIAEYYQRLRNRYDNEWDGISSGLSDRPVEYYDELESLYSETSRYFQGMQPETTYAQHTRWNPKHYIDLVTAHLREAPRSYLDALSAIADGRGHNISSDGDRYWRGEAMLYYWFYMPDYVRVMKWRGCDNADLVEEAWITLVFRAFLWMRAHIPCHNPHPLPSQYYGSRLPIYIG